MSRPVDVCAAVQEAALEVLAVPVEGWRQAYWERDPNTNTWRGHVYGGFFEFHEQKDLNFAAVSAEIKTVAVQRLGWTVDEAEKANLQVNLKNGADGHRSWLQWVVNL